MSILDSNGGGAFLIDKPAGPTSADVVNQIKKKLKIKRVGHTGTLDPFATGLLVVLFGKATKLQDIFMGGQKEYQGNILLGTKTSTDDITGEVLESREITKQSWEEIAKSLTLTSQKFTGEISQVPPIVSAIKVNGERSYKKARRGEDFNLPARSVFIESLDLAVSQEPEISYRVTCSKGTYVRSLARDIGESLETIACVKTLRREKSEPFSVTSAITLDKLLDSEQPQSYAISFRELTESFPQFEISIEETKEIRLGKQDVLNRLPKSDCPHAILYNPASQEAIAMLDRPQIEGSPWKIRFVL